MDSGKRVKRKNSLEPLKFDGKRIFPPGTLVQSKRHEVPDEYFLITEYLGQRLNDIDKGPTHVYKGFCLKDNSAREIWNYRSGTRDWFAWLPE